MDNNPISGPAPMPNPEPTPTPTPEPGPAPAPAPNPNIPVGNTPVATSPFTTQPIGAPTQGKKSSGKLIGILAGVVVLAVIVVVVLLLTSNSKSNPSDDNPDSNPDISTDTNPDTDTDTNPDSSDAVDSKRRDDYTTLFSSISEQRPEVGVVDAASYMGSEVDPNGVPYTVKVVDYESEDSVYPTANENSTEVIIVLKATCSGKGTPVLSDSPDSYAVYGATDDVKGYCI